MQAADEINPDGVFVRDERHGTTHPQKQAHSHLLGYHQLIANKEYTVRAQDMWQEELKDRAGHTYEVTVPANRVVDLDADTLTLDSIETTTEALSLETLHYRWGLRSIEVRHERRDSWSGAVTNTSRERVWLPPKGIQLAFEQLEDVRAKIGLAAELGTPDYHETTVLDPVDGVREPHEEDR